MGVKNAKGFNPQNSPRGKNLREKLIGKENHQLEDFHGNKF